MFPQPRDHSPFENSRSAGRPSLFSDALVDQICDYIQNTGVSDSAAGLLAGVSTTTLSRWKAENPDFAILLEAARAELQRELITTVREARRRDGSSDWRGAAWLLEHLFPEDFGRRPRSKAQSPSPNDSDGPRFQVNRSGQLPETLDFAPVVAPSLTPASAPAFAAAPIRLTEVTHARQATPNHTPGPDPIPEFDPTRPSEAALAGPILPPELITTNPAIF